MYTSPHLRSVFQKRIPIYRIHQPVDDVQHHKRNGEQHTGKLVHEERAIASLEVARLLLARLGDGGAGANRSRAARLSRTTARARLREVGAGAAVAQQTVLCRLLHQVAVAGTGGADLERRPALLRHTDTAVTRGTNI